MLKTKINLIKRINFKIFSNLLKIFKPINELYFNIWGNKKCKFPPIFIVGAPRTGSTLVYQCITNYYNIFYISNFSSFFYHSILIGSFLNHLIYKNKPHNSFKSRFGITFGLNSPSECGHFWYRWFPKNKSFTKYDDISKMKLLKIYKIISIITNTISKPIIFKNLNNSNRIKIFKEIFPDALFIFIKRKPLFTAQSILKSRLDYYGRKDIWFSVFPNDMNKLRNLDYPEQIVKQIFYIEKQIYEDLSELYPNQWIKISYEKFCDNCIQEMIRIKKFFLKNGLLIYERNGASLPNLNFNNNIKVSQYDYILLKKEVEKLDWIKYTNFNNGSN